MDRGFSCRPMDDCVAWPQQLTVLADRQLREAEGATDALSFHLLLSVLEGRFGAPHHLVGIHAGGAEVRHRVKAGVQAGVGLIEIDSGGCARDGAREAADELARSCLVSGGSENSEAALAHVPDEGRLPALPAADVR